MSPAAPVPAHPRQAIRKKVVELLLGKTGAGSRVWPSRMRHVSARDLPAIGVYTTEETGDTGNASPRTYTRTVTVVVDCVVEANEQLDDALDALCLQVEQALLADRTLGGVAADFAYTKTGIGFVTNGRTEDGCASIEFEADYETAAVTEAVDDFGTGGVRWDMAPPDGVVDAEDEITLAQEE